MPPPIPVTPATKPIIAPAMIEGSKGRCGGVSSSVAAAERADFIMRCAATINGTKSPNALTLLRLRRDEAILRGRLDCAPANVGTRADRHAASVGIRSLISVAAAPRRA
jgi:hypothetical protein